MWTVDSFIVTFTKGDYFRNSAFVHAKCIRPWLDLNLVYIAALSINKKE